MFRLKPVLVRVAFNGEQTSGSSNLLLFVIDYIDLLQRIHSQLSSKKLIVRVRKQSESVFILELSQCIGVLDRVKSLFGINPLESVEKAVEISMNTISLKSFLKGEKPIAVKVKHPTERIVSKP